MGPRIIDHDTAADPLDFDCEEDALRSEEVWEEAIERVNSESLSGSSRSSDCEGAEVCWVCVNEGLSRSGSTTSLDDGGSSDLVPDWFDSVAGEDRGFVCPRLVPTFCFFVGLADIKDEGWDDWDAGNEGESFRF